jgi:hypothetical protein
VDVDDDGDSHAEDDDEDGVRVLITFSNPSISSLRCRIAMTKRGTMILQTVPFESFYVFQHAGVVR